jgi:hypothetical protein
MPATFTPSEVSLHNHADDCWVSFFGDVYDLTTLINSYKGEALAALTMVWHGGPAGGTQSKHLEDLQHGAKGNRIGDR